MTCPQPLPKRVLQTLRSSASCFNFQYPLVSFRSIRNCLRLLPCSPVTCIPDTDRGELKCSQKSQSHCRFAQHKPAWYSDAALTSYRVAQIPGAACSAAMRCAMWRSHVVMLLTVTSAVRMREVLSAFVEDLVRLQHWRAMVLVYCTG